MKPEAGNNHRRIVCKQEMLSTSNLGKRQKHRDEKTPQSERDKSKTQLIVLFFAADEQQISFTFKTFCFSAFTFKQTCMILLLKFKIHSCKLRKIGS